MPLQAVVFDFDGLILDTETCVFDGVGEVFREHGADLTLDAWTNVIGGSI